MERTGVMRKNECDMVDMADVSPMNIYMTRLYDKLTCDNALLDYFHMMQDADNMVDNVKSPTTSALCEKIIRNRRV